MDHRPLEIADNGNALRAERIGFAKLAQLAFDGCDLRPLLQETLSQDRRGDRGGGRGASTSR